MRKIFLDSDYLIDYLRGKPYTKELIGRVIKKDFDANVSVVTAFELYTGAMLSDNPNKSFEEVETLLNWMSIVNIDRAIMRTAASINVSLRKKGAIIGIQDILIAASAVSLNIPLLTNNKKHFGSISGLNLE